LAAAALTTAEGRRFRFGFGNLGYWIVLGVVLVMVVVPVVLIIVNSFETSAPGQPATYSLDGWRQALFTSGIVNAILNTFKLVFARLAVAFPVSILLAWILARTDIPGANWLEFMFWIAFFLPALPVTLGWIMLADPQYGLLNQAFKLLPFVHGSVFNIYSFWGIVWAHFAGGTLAVQVMLLTGAFRNMDATLEEASNVSGSSPLGTLWRIVIPVMTPVLTVVLLLGVIFALQSFEIEMVLGFPIRFFVFSTQIYFSLQQQPPLFAAAMAMSTIILAALVPLIFIQRWASGRRRFTTVTGHFKAQKLRLRRWRGPVFALVLTIALMITVVPFCFLMLATFMKLLGFFNLAAPWTLDHWTQVLNDPIFARSVLNTLLLGGGTVICGLVLSVLIAYIVMRTKFVARVAMDFASWLPATFPGIILGLGLLWLFLGVPMLRGLYGTIFLLIVATVVSSMTITVQLLKSNLAQLGFDMEEAARVEGGSWLQALRHVLLPIMAPTLLMVGTLSFISAARNVATVALLATSSTRPLSLLQLDMMVQGSYESAAVVGVIVAVLTTGIAVIARLLGLRTAVAA